MQKHWLTQREKRNESRHWHLSVGWGLRCGWQWLTLRTRSDWLRLRQPGQLHAHQPQTSQDTTLEHAGKQSPSECLSELFRVNSRINYWEEGYFGSFLALGGLILMVHFQVFFMIDTIFPFKRFQKSHDLLSPSPYSLLGRNERIAWSRY